MRNYIRFIWYYICKYILLHLSDSIFYNLLGFITHARFGKKYRWMNLRSPVTFNEKVNYLKVNRPQIDGTLWADKVAVREYVSEKIGEKYLIPLHGVYSDAREIDFDKLPKGFALKTNHGSGWNIICNDKNKLDKNKSVTKLNKWLKYNAYYLSREWQYKDIKPKIMCEELLVYDIYDYKFFCFHGKPKIIQVDVDRFTNHTRAFFDENWNRLDFSLTYPQTEKEIEKPEQYEEMYKIASVLAANTIFLRIDLYIHNDKVFFGEITLHPEGGFAPFIPEKYNKVIGELINI